MALQLFVQGDILQPAAVTQILGIEPQTAHALGDTWTSSSGVAHVRKVGLWKWGVSEDTADADLSSLALSFCARLKHAAGILNQLPGAERAWIDVFVCREQPAGASAEIAFDLSPAALCALGSLNLPVEFTTDVVAADAIESPI
ncbi:MAG: DUF4279 domain-containing protein [Pseudomonadota bacterium]